MALMRFDNLMHYDLMTGLYIFIFSFDFPLLTWTVFTLHYVIQYVKEFKINALETVSEVSQKSSVKIVTHVTKNGIKK